MIPSWDGPVPEPQVRTVDDLRRVLASPECPCSEPAYYMYRDLARRQEDRDWLLTQRVRFDITVIPPKTICGEYVKTKGHYHPENDDGVAYPELYEVLAGEGHFLLQSLDLRDIVCINATMGEKVLVPPGYGHVTINPSPVRTLVMANLVSSEFESIYSPYEERCGAAYYEMIGNQFVRNPCYGRIGGIRCASSLSDGTLGIREREGLYFLVEKRRDLSFLNHPELLKTEFRLD
ncbi:MAG: glucose-6-phosphate isomerase family protein [Methanomicrobiales archaeon]|nr:glucose-6-phosphate isomerase family protein [Methanomicrobiales archaeon]